MSFVDCYEDLNIIRIIDNLENHLKKCNICGNKELLKDSNISVANYANNVSSCDESMESHVVITCNKCGHEYFFNRAIVEKISY